MGFEVEKEVQTPKFIVTAHGLIEKDGKYLVTRRPAHDDYMPLMWDLPGGKVEFKESPEEAVEREIKEETGLIVIVDKVLFVFSKNINEKSKKQYIEIVYKCKYLSGDIELNQEEHDQFAWVNKNEMKDYDDKCLPFVKGFINSDVFKNL